MIHSYVIELENRLNTIKQLIGDLPQNYDAEIKTAKQKIDQIIQKTVSSKDTQHKYNKINNFVNKHNDVLDSTLSSDKMNIVLDQLDELKQVSESLNKIQKLLPALQTSEYLKQRDRYDKVYILRTSSEVALNKQDGIEIKKYNEKPLTKIIEEQRNEMASIMQLNYRMLNNLNQKIRLAYQRKNKK